MLLYKALKYKRHLFQKKVCLGLARLENGCTFAAALNARRDLKSQEKRCESRNLKTF